MKEQLKDLLIDMMMTSPSRDWYFESKNTAEEIKEKREENLDHIESYVKIIMDLIK